MGSVITSRGASPSVNTHIPSPLASLTARGLGLAITALVLAWSGGSLLDPDMWWHVRTGRLVLDDLRVPHTDPWSFTAPPDSWVPTAWLSDVLFALAWHIGGYDGVRLLRVMLAVAVIAALWLVARRFACSSATAALAFTACLLAVAPFLRERPQVISFVLVAWLALLLQRVLAGERPAIVSTVAVVYLWANLHGMWILAPVAIAGAGVLVWAEDRRRVPLAARCVLVGMVGWASVLLTPTGPRTAVWPFIVRDAAAPITEWQPTVPWTPLALPYFLMTALVLVSWARSTTRIPPSRVTYVLAVTGFALLAFRNVAPAAILLLPEFARALPSRVPASVPRVPTWGLAGVALGLSLAGWHAASSPTVDEDQPTRIAEALAARPSTTRVLNHYDVGGLLTGVSAPRALVAIDGRTDMWSPSFVREYIDAFNGAGDWRPLVDRLNPDAALVRLDSEIARGLTVERSWRVSATDGNWALLEPGR